MSHANQPILHAGAPLEEAQAVVLLVHGRGATAESILTLANEFESAADDTLKLAYLAPQARGNTWYPYSFLSPIPQNEPGISSGIALLDNLVEELAGRGIPYERMVLGGFSQGACLALEFVARHARRYGGAFGYSGGLIGPDGTSRDYPGSLAGTPVFLGCSDVDFHIPKERVQLTADVLEKLGGQVTMRLYPGMGHTVNQDEIDSVRQMIAQVVEQPET